MNFKQIKMAGKHDNRNLFFSAIIKILINHFQLFSFLRFMNFNWQTFATNFLTLQSYLLDISESTSSIDCILNENSSFPGLYLKTLIFAILPYTLFLMIFVCVYFKSRKARLTNFIIISLISLEIVNPSIINTMIESITCFEFEDKYYLRKDMTYECYNDQHVYYVIFFIYFF